MMNRYQSAEYVVQMLTELESGVAVVCVPTRGKLLGWRDVWGVIWLGGGMGSRERGGRGVARGGQHLSGHGPGAHGVDDCIGHAALPSGTANEGATHLLREILCPLQRWEERQLHTKHSSDGFCNHMLDRLFAWHVWPMPSMKRSFVNGAGCLLTSPACVSIQQLEDKYRQEMGKPLR